MSPPSMQRICRPRSVAPTRLQIAPPSQHHRCHSPVSPPDEEAASPQLADLSRTIARRLDRRVRFQSFKTYLDTLSTDKSSPADTILFDASPCSEFSVPVGDFPTAAPKLKNQTYSVLDYLPGPQKPAGHHCAKCGSSTQSSTVQSAADSIDPHPCDRSLLSLESFCEKLKNIEIMANNTSKDPTRPQAQPAVKDSSRSEAEASEETLELAKARARNEKLKGDVNGWIQKMREECRHDIARRDHAAAEREVSEFTVVPSLQKADAIAQTEIQASVAAPRPRDSATPTVRYAKKTVQVAAPIRNRYSPMESGSASAKSGGIQMVPPAARARSGLRGAGIDWRYRRPIDLPQMVARVRRYAA